MTMSIYKYMFEAHMRTINSYVRPTWIINILDPKPSTGEYVSIHIWRILPLPQPSASVSSPPHQRAHAFTTRWELLPHPHHLLSISSRAPHCKNWLISSLYTFLLFKPAKESDVRLDFYLRWENQASKKFISNE